MGQATATYERTCPFSVTSLISVTFHAEGLSVIFMIRSSFTYQDKQNCFKFKQVFDYDYQKRGTQGKTLNLEMMTFQKLQTEELFIMVTYCQYYNC